MQMAKRRTKKSKVAASHQFVVDVEKLAISSTPASTVKRELSDSYIRGQNKNKVSNKARYTAKDQNVASIKKDIIKSLSLAVFILALELMIYLSR
jgi:hypothetical protein